MKFNVKIGGSDSENEDGTEQDLGQDQKGEDQAQPAGPLKRKLNFKVGEAEARDDTTASSVTTLEDAGTSEAGVPADSTIDSDEDTPRQLAAGEDEDAFFDDFFSGDDEVEEVMVDDLALEPGDEEGWMEPDLDAQWEDLLEPDEDEVAEDNGADAFVNPLLEDEDDEEAAFDGKLEQVATREPGGEEKELAPTKLDSSPDEQERSSGLDSASAGEREEKASAKKAKRIIVPVKPELSEQDRLNQEQREQAEKASRAARKKTGESGSLDEQDNQVGHAHKISYEISVDESGRERELRKAARSEKGKKVSGDAAPVEVIDSEGRKKWTARKDAGRLSQSQLSVYRNLNRAGGSGAAEEVVRELFSRASEEGLTDAEAKRRKKLANRAVFGMEQVGAGSRKRFTEKDREVLRFIGMFKYANARHIARIQQVKEDTMLRRLYALGERGMVLKKDLYGAKPLWYLTEAGLICSGLDVPRVRESGITYSMLPHQFVVNHVAGNLWGAGVNVLALEDFPDKYRRTEDGLLVPGESLVSEYEVQSSFASAKAANHKADVYRPAITASMNREFTRWSTSGKDPEGSPEMVLGNEYMWTLFPPMALRLAYHVPDLVVKRPRNADGTPNSIAVEVELANKPIASYERTLNAFKFDSLIYAKVVWVVKSRGAARKIQEAAKKIGTWDEGRVGIVPIYTEDGVFKGKAEWTI